MVRIEDIERKFRKFRSKFWEDVIDTNLSKNDANVEKLKTKMIESDYFETVKRFAEERGWKISSKDTMLTIHKDDKKTTVELPLVEIDEDTIFIQPWSRVAEKLEALEKPLSGGVKKADKD